MLAGAAVSSFSFYYLVTAPDEQMIIALSLESNFVLKLHSDFCCLLEEILN